MSTTTRYAWCPGSTTPYTANTAGTVTVYEPQGEYSAATSPTKRYYARDRLGSVMQVVDAAGNVLGQRLYAAYGRAYGATGVVPAMGYAGMWTHAPSGRSVTPNRAYSGATGRWLSKDPMGEAGGMNLYAYVGGNPLSVTDPIGLMGGGGNHAPSPPAPAVNDPCVEKYLHDNYGDFGGFIATIVNLQQFIPSANPDWWATTKEGAEIGIEKTAASKGVKFVGNAMMRAVPGNLAIGHVVGSGLATFGGTASGVVEVAGAVLTPFGTAAMAMARSACTCQK